MSRQESLIRILDDYPLLLVLFMLRQACPELFGGLSTNGVLLQERFFCFCGFAMLPQCT